MITLVLTHDQYAELTSQLVSRDLVRFRFDMRREELHYPRGLKLTDELGAEIVFVCGMIGSNRHLTIRWDSVGEMEAYAIDAMTGEVTNRIGIKILEEET